MNGISAAANKKYLIFTIFPFLKILAAPHFKYAPEYLKIHIRLDRPGLVVITIGRQHPQTLPRYALEPLYESLVFNPEEID